MYLVDSNNSDRSLKRLEEVFLPLERICRTPFQKAVELHFADGETFPTGSRRAIA